MLQKSLNWFECTSTSVINRVQRVLANYNLYINTGKSNVQLSYNYNSWIPIRAFWIYSLLRVPTYTTFSKYNTQDCGHHLLKKQTVGALLTAGFLGSLPGVFYWYPIYLENSCSWAHFFVFSGLLYSLFLWTSSISYEANTGAHTRKIQTGLRLGFSLFLISEIMFFLSIFWSFFYFSLNPTIFIGGSWPPFGVPKTALTFGCITNTITLLFSGITLTFAYKALFVGNREEASVMFLASLLLSSLFSLIQDHEYFFSFLQISDGVYGSIFFYTTAVHGLHVIVGSVLASICYYEHFCYRLLKNQYVLLECTLWYWHFVDIVWLFVVCIYYWEFSGI